MISKLLMPRATAAMTSNVTGNLVSDSTYEILTEPQRASTANEQKLTAKPLIEVLSSSSVSENNVKSGSVNIDEDSSDIDDSQVVDEENDEEEEDEPDFDWELPQEIPDYVRPFLLSCSLAVF
jgi:hypothetical protein